jgi:hypothetical protein
MGGCADLPPVEMVVVTQIGPEGQYHQLRWWPSRVGRVKPLGPKSVGRVTPLRPKPLGRMTPLGRRASQSSSGRKM